MRKGLCVIAGDVIRTDTKMDSAQKLKQDLSILEMMAAEMEEYLVSDVLFWPMQRGDLPRLTLGGYLLRQHRLLALSSLLDDAERDRLSAAMAIFQAALVERIVRFEARAHEELEVRLRQWERFLDNSAGEDRSSAAYYATSVENRAMIEALVNELQIGPYQLEQRPLEKRQLLDNYLRAHWRTGDFVWPEEWQAAYPMPEYWWLYGLPA